MKKLTTATLIMIATVSMALAQAPAQKPPETQPIPKKAAAVSMKEHKLFISGEVVSVDTTANTVTLKSKSGKIETINVNPATVIKKDGKAIQLAELSTGTKVMVTYKVEGDKKYALSIKEKMRFGGIKTHK